MVRRGHDVVVCTHEFFAPFVQSHGLEHAPLAGDPSTLIKSAEGQAWQSSRTNPLKIVRRLVNLAGELYEQTFEDVRRAARGADLIAFSALGVAGYHVAETAGIPSVGAFLQPLTPTRSFASPAVHPLVNRFGPATRRASHVAVRQLLWLATRRRTNSQRSALGLPPLRRLSRVVDAMPVLYGYSPTFVARPPDWPANVRVTGYWTLDLDPAWKPPPDLVDFIAGGPPPVYVGFGSRWSDSARAQASKILDALESAGSRAVIGRGWGGLDPGAEQDHVYVVDEIPHRWLFPKMAAVVHHGGAGTTAAAAEAGVPQILVPSFADQFFWADRVRRSGIGLVSRVDASFDDLSRQLRTVVGEEFTHRAVALAAGMRTEDGTGVATELLERIEASQDLPPRRLD